MRATKIQPGQYTAVQHIQLGLMQGKRIVEYTEYRDGESFSVPETVNGFWYGAIFYPEFDEEMPEYIPSDATAIA